MLDGLDGSDLAQIALQIRPSLKVLFTSGFPQTSFASGWLAQPQLLLSKPYRKAELAEMVRVALES